MSQTRQTCRRPLEAFPAFAAANFDRLSDILENQLSAKFMRLPVRGDNIEAVANSAQLTHTQLWYCSYGMPLSVKFPDGDYIRLQMQHRGTGGAVAEVAAGAHILKADNVVFEADTLLSFVMGASTITLTPASISIAGLSIKIDGAVAETAALIADN